MKVLLMHGDADFDPRRAPAGNEAALRMDLGLDALLRAMAGEDEFLHDIARRAVLAASRVDRDTILYRQAILRDCLREPAIVRQVYALAIEAIEGRKKHYFGFFSRYPSGILSGSLDLLGTLLGVLEKLREVARANAGRFESRGFTALFAMLDKELAEGYLADLRQHLAELKFRQGILVSVELGAGGRAGVNHVLRKPQAKRANWYQRIFRNGPRAYTFRLHNRDEAGATILADLGGRGINVVANAAAQSAEHVLSFFEALQTELAFYIGCLNLHARLSGMGLPMCFPEPVAAGERAYRFRELRDPSLALHLGRAPTGNTIDADGRSLAIITGPNQGGKSSFLRATGVAQLMMQAGMFVAAESFRGELCAGLFTHYKREEDPTMKSGKLDEELARMSEIADLLEANSLVLFNESFAATNEREGSEIARQVVRALLERNVKIFFVTHLYDFAHGFFARGAGDALFLRAERKDDGSRSFRMVPCEPLETSYGEDVFRDVFGAVAEDDAPAAAASARMPIGPRLRSIGGG